MDTLVKIDNWLTRILEGILVLLFFGFFTMVCLLVLLRYGFAATIIGGNEGVTIAFVFTVAIGAATAIARHEHIAITAFINILPRRARTCVHVLGLLLVALINIAMIRYSIGWISLTGAVPWYPFSIPQGYFQSAIPIGCTLAVFFCFVKVILTMAGRDRSETLHG